MIKQNFYQGDFVKNIKNDTNGIILHRAKDKTNGKLRGFWVIYDKKNDVVERIPEFLLEKNV